MDLKKIGQALDTYLRPQTFPVAVRLTASSEEIPEKARRPKRDMGVTMPVCQGVSVARRYGWLVAMGKEDMGCPLGSITLGLQPAKDKFLDGSINIPPWIEDNELRAKFCQGTPRFDYGTYTDIILSPLNLAAFDPQVVIIYGNPAQLGRLVQAVVSTTGEPVTTMAAGGFACAGEITVPIQTDTCQCIITGGGVRSMAQAQDHEAAFAIPAGMLEKVVEGLETTHKFGMRYPTRSFLTYQAQFPPLFSELDAYLNQPD
jgi:uncharacterized protein (DUF169 family)